MPNLLDPNCNPELAADYALIRSGGPGWHVAFKRFRLALGLGQKTIAKRMGIHPTALTKWEHGRSQPSREARESALAAIGWTPPPPPPSEPPPDTESVKLKPPSPIREKEYLLKGPDWEPPRYTPRPCRRPYRANHVYPDVRPEDDPDCPYFYSK